jgi:hypothetical protein
MAAAELRKRRKAMGQLRRAQEDPDHARLSKLNWNEVTYAQVAEDKSMQKYLIKHYLKKRCSVHKQTDKACLWSCRQRLRENGFVLRDKLRCFVDEELKRQYLENMQQNPAQARLLPVSSARGRPCVSEKSPARIEYIRRSQSSVKTLTSSGSNAERSDASVPVRNTTRPGVAAAESSAAADIGSLASSDAEEDRLGDDFKQQFPEEEDDGDDDYLQWFKDPVTGNGDDGGGDGKNRLRTRNGNRNAERTGDKWNSDSSDGEEDPVHVVERARASENDDTSEDAERERREQQESEEDDEEDEFVSPQQDLRRALQILKRLSRTAQPRQERSDTVKNGHAGLKRSRDESEAPESEVALQWERALAFAEADFHRSEDWGNAATVVQEDVSPEVLHHVLRLRAVAAVSHFLTRAQPTGAQALLILSRMQPHETGPVKFSRHACMSMASSGFLDTIDYMRSGEIGMRCPMECPSARHAENAKKKAENDCALLEQTMAYMQVNASTGVRN